MSVIRTARQQDTCPIALFADLQCHLQPTPTAMPRLPVPANTNSRGP